MINLFKNKDLRWKRFQGGNDFDYPIDYSAALLNANQDGHVDILYRWEPDCYCHFHRHTAEVSSVVLEGELHVIDIDLASGEKTVTKIRSAGDLREITKSIFWFIFISFSTSNICKRSASIELLVSKFFVSNKSL